ncbi:hypothetical protein DSO57_1014127 [Entomophthora muscae]|uniref:Uncharacterized protein n=1 Tax=Entomophthora muscae TaxID=34485 RepID=A0ACC2RK86_9FUNG|nr:hypothetical protein DSO57_1014127 [Entomophthora muscae]
MDVMTLPYEGSSACLEDMQDVTLSRTRNFEFRLRPEPPAFEISLFHSFSWSRLAFLVVISLCLTGNYFAYDLPAALNRQMKVSLGSSYENWQLELAVLYSAYSIPNVFLPFLTAKDTELFGSRSMLLLFSLLVVLGQYLVASGLESQNFILMVAGRVLLGIGGESIGISQAQITCRWFPETWLNLALSINLGVARFGSVLSYILSPYLASWLAPGDLILGTVRTTWVGFGCCIGSAICAALVVSIDALLFSGQAAEPLESSTLDQEASHLLRNGAKYPTYGTGKSMMGARLGRRAALPSTWITGAEPEMRAMVEETRSINLISANFPGLDSSNVLHTPREVKGGFGLYYWFICLVIICYYGSVIPFTNVSSDFLQQRWYPDQPHLAGFLLAIPDLLSTLLVPAFGRLLGGTAERFWTTGMAGIGVCLTHALLAKKQTIAPIWLMSGLGLSYALLAASLWSLIPLVVPERLLSSAYRTSTCLLNGVLALGPLTVAVLINADPSYIVLELTLSGLGLFGALVSFVLLWLVYRNETYMRPSEQEEAIADDYEPVEEDVDFYLDISKDDGDSWPGMYSDLDMHLQTGLTPSSSMGFGHSPPATQPMHPPVTMAGFPGSVLQAGESNESLLSRQLRTLSLSRSGSQRSRLIRRLHKTKSRSSLGMVDDLVPPDDSTSLPDAPNSRISYNTFPRPPPQNRRSGLFYSALQSQLDPYPDPPDPK